jgi:hypothetical protein
MEENWEFVAGNGESSVHLKCERAPARAPTR